MNTANVQAMELWHASSIRNVSVMKKIYFAAAFISTFLQCGMAFAASSDFHTSLHLSRASQCEAGAKMSCMELAQSTIPTVKISLRWDSGACQRSSLNAGAYQQMMRCENAIAAGKGLPTERLSAFIELAYFYNLHSTENFAGKSGQQLSLVWLNRAIRQNPDSLDTLNAEADFLMFRNEEASNILPIFDRMIEIAPNDWRGFLGKAEVLGSQGRIAQAHSASLKAVNLAPGNAIVNFVHARILIHERNFAEASKYFEKAAQNYHPETFVSRGSKQPSPIWPAWANAESHVSGNKRAAEIMTQYIEMRPDTEHTQLDYLRRARYLAGAQLYKDAEADYDKAIQIQGPARPEDLHLERFFNAIRSGSTKPDFSQFEDKRDPLLIRKVLKLQLFLKHGGYKTVEITGSLDAPTKAALSACAHDPSCKAVEGTKL